MKLVEVKKKDLHRRKYRVLNRVSKLGSKLITGRSKIDAITVIWKLVS